MTPNPSAPRRRRRRPPTSRGRPRAVVVTFLVSAAVAACSDSMQPELPLADPVRAVVPGAAAAVFDLQPDSAVVEVGQATHFSVIALDSVGDTVFVAVSYAVGDSTVAVVDSSGMVTGINPGRTVVFASEPGGLSDTAAVTVHAAQPPPGLPVVVVSPDSAFLEVGESTPFAAIVLEPTGDTIFGSATFAILDPAIAVVDSAGLVTGVAPGTTLLFVSSPGAIPDTAHVAVFEAPPPPVGPADLVLTPGSAVIAIDETVQLTAVVLDSVGEPLPTFVAFSVSDPSVATVDTLGLVTGRSAGTTLVVALAGESLADTSVVEVVAPDPHALLASLVDAVEALDASGAFRGWQAERLVAHLRRAAYALERDRPRMAVYHLRAFIRLADEILESGVGAPLIEAAEDLIDVLAG